MSKRRRQMQRSVFEGEIERERGAQERAHCSSPWVQIHRYPTSKAGNVDGGDC